MGALANRPKPRHPLTFPDGMRVYCLVDHDYHTCGPKQAACCLDGSKPLHGERPHDDAPALVQGHMMHQLLSSPIFSGSMG